MLPLVPPPELLSLLAWFAPCFTRPSFLYFVHYVVAMIAVPERLTATTVWRGSDGSRHFTNFARFLTRYRWQPSDLGQRLLNLLLARLPLWRDDQGRPRLCVVVDETLVAKSSRRMFGVSWHFNHREDRLHSHILGHYWLLLGVLFPWRGRTLCFPLGLRLYRLKKDCPPQDYHTPGALVLELLESLKWPQRRGLVRTLIGDAGFADRQIQRWCAEHGWVMVTRGRLDAAVYELEPPRRSGGPGRPRKWIHRLSLKALAAAESNFTQAASLYQDRRKARLASLVGRHYRSDLPMRFVIVRLTGRPDVVLMSMDLSLTPREIAQLYADRFAIEMTFRELKQHFGLGHYQVRAAQGIERHVQLSAVACALTQLLTLRPPEQGFARGRLHPQPCPWRKPGTPTSVHETQLLLRLACQGSANKAPVALRPPPRRKNHAPASHAGRPRVKSAEL